MSRVDHHMTRAASHSLATKCTIEVQIKLAGGAVKMEGTSLVTASITNELTDFIGRLRNQGQMVGRMRWMFDGS